MAVEAYEGIADMMKPIDTLRVFVGVAGACFALFSAGCTTLVENTVVVGTAAIPEAGTPAIPEAGIPAIPEAGPEASTDASTPAVPEVGTDAGPEASPTPVADAGAGTDARCTPETDAVFCAWYFDGGCGSFSGRDSCGVLREAVQCGSCPPVDAGVPDAASACKAETDTAFCTRLGKNCGSVTAPDNCGESRTVASCGAPETNYEFCVRLGKSCGAVTANDNCGATRTVVSCGACVAPDTCTGANTCACTHETDMTFCASNGKNCGAVSNWDNCGTPRTALCGACAAPQTCVANVCGCWPETAAALCARLGMNCGTVITYDTCGTLRTIASCGMCPAPQVCSGGSRTNVCGP